MAKRKGSKRRLEDDGLSDLSTPRKESRDGFSVEDLEDQPSVGSLVFFCRHCRAIVGDSLSITSSNEAMATISFCQASNILRQDALTTSSGPSPDQGSTYFAIDCAQCSSTIGKFYITTPKALDEMRECFTFYTDELQSYELGKGDFGRPQSPAPPAAQPPQGSDFHEELAKIHHVLLGLEHRLSQLEAKVS